MTFNYFQEFVNYLNAHVTQLFIRLPISVIIVLRMTVKKSLLLQFLFIKYNVEKSEEFISLNACSRLPL